MDPLPHYIPPNENAQSAPALAKRYPLSLISPKSHAFLNSNYANMPAQTAQAGEEQAVVLHPDDAVSRGIMAGTPIRVFNDRGSFEAFATVSSDVMPGVVVAPSGYWQRSNRRGATVHALTPPAFADLGRAPTFSTPRAGRQALNDVRARGGRSQSRLVRCNATDDLESNTMAYVVTDNSRAVVTPNASRYARSSAFILARR